MIKNRRTWLAGLLSLCFPGLGHVYSARAQRGIVFLLIFFAVPFLLSTVFPIAEKLWIFCVFLLIAISIRILIIIDSILIAKKQSPVKLKWYNKPYWYAFLLICGIGLSLLQFSFHGKLYGFLNYQVPSISMAPTIQPGDFILVDPRAFEHRKPQMGDITIMIPPGNPHTKYIKRVIGLPGDVVAIKNGVININGSPVHIADIPSDERQTPSSITFGPVRVPANRYFVLGDNRDNSVDSRTFGFVSRSSLIGKVTYIWFSSKMNRIGKRL